MAHGRPQVGGVQRGDGRAVEQAKEAKLFEINTAAQAFIDNQTGANHIPVEIQTWSLLGGS